MTDLHDDDKAREPFRPKFIVDDVARITKDSNYTYKCVIYTYRHAPLAVQDHEKEGYEVVYSTDHVDDDRKFSPNSTASGDKAREPKVPRPVLGTTKDGYQHVLMRISKKRETENAIKNAKLEQERYKRKVKSQRRSQSGLNVAVDGGEINLTNGETDNE